MLRKQKSAEILSWLKNLIFPTPQAWFLVLANCEFCIYSLMSCCIMMFVFWSCLKLPCFDHNSYCPLSPRHDFIAKAWFLCSQAGSSPQTVERWVWGGELPHRDRPLPSPTAFDQTYKTAIFTKYCPHSLHIGQGGSCIVYYTTKTMTLILSLLQIITSPGAHWDEALDTNYYRSLTHLLT